MVSLAFSAINTIIADFLRVRGGEQVTFELFDVLEELIIGARNLGKGPPAILNRPFAKIARLADEIGDVDPLEPRNHIV